MGSEGSEGSTGFPFWEMVFPLTYDVFLRSG